MTSGLLLAETGFAYSVYAIYNSMGTFYREEDNMMALSRTTGKDIFVSLRTTSRRIRLRDAIP